MAAGFIILPVSSAEMLIIIIENKMTYILSFVLLLGMIPSMVAPAAKEIILSAKKLKLTKGKSKKLKAANTQKKVTWTAVFGKQCISLKKKRNMSGIIVINGSS